MPANNSADNSRKYNGPSSIVPWITVRDSREALLFYQNAFSAAEVYRMEDPGGGLVLRLSVQGAEFWLSNGAEGEGPQNTGGGTVRMILTVSNPDILFDQSVAAGATIIFPIGEDYGWRLGRIADPFGLHWEIGHPLGEPD